MLKSLMVGGALMLLFGFASASEEGAERIVIIKADDVRGRSDRWERFFALSKEKGVTVSAGIICNSLAKATKDDLDWLRSLQRAGQVEFWNHGYDHKRWTTEKGKSMREFHGTGAGHQRKHIAEGQALMKKALGTTALAFGAPFNSMDQDTYDVLNAIEEIRLIFAHGMQGLKNKVLAPMTLRGEHDGTGNPNFEKFREQYQKKADVKFTALQFHPNGFNEKDLAEYGRIIDFLLAEGWTFMLPGEYLSKVKKQGQGSPAHAR